MKVEDRIRGLGTILGIWAHPDDETFSMGGLMAVATQNGQTVACITATKGEQGVQDEAKWPAERLAEIRETELENALQILGVTNHHWLGYSDGACAAIEDTVAVNNIVPFIEKYRPDTVITFPPDGLTGHDDHRSVSRWTRLAVEASAVNTNLYYAVDTKEIYDKYLREADQKFNIFFMVDEPVLIPEAECDMAFTFSDEVVALKLDALKVMPSQTSGMFEGNDSHWMEGSLCCEAFVSSDRSSEYWA